MIQTILTSAAFAKRIVNWYQQHGRSTLPWQRNQTAYRVWISEIMLQQTQVATVIPYFKRFMQRFPNVESLASADLDEVLHLWTGLGYYSRARNIHKAAQKIVHEFGKFPQDFDDILSLPGIGRSTAGAISAFSFQQRQAILDGNVKRVLARAHAIPGWPGQKKVHDLLWQYADFYTPQKNIAEYTQAMMDLGAMVCTQSKPQCEQCPLQDRCMAYLLGKPTAFPQKKPKTEKPIRQTHLLMFRNAKQEYWLERRPESGIWGGLYAFPELTDLQELHERYAIKKFATLPTFRHTFTHFHLDITPVLIPVNQKQAEQFESKQALWFNPSYPAEIGLAKPVKSLLTQLELKHD